jgi:hypothetical protein
MDFVVVDEDRLVFANKSGLVLWTPVASDPTGDGNDERYEHDQDAFKNLDSGQGGELTGFIGPVNGYIFAFKRSTIYKLVRTGQRSKAYTAVCLTRELGALPGSVVQGIDQNGSPCLYFTDPNIGPCRISERGGIQQCGRDLETTWERINVNADTVVSRAVYYPDTKQVHWWLAADDEDTPSLRIMLQTNEQRETEDGDVRGGWTIHEGRSSFAIAACMFAENIDDDTDRSHVLRPFIALAGDFTPTGLIQRCDTGSTDDGESYTARIVTRPLSPAGLLNEFGLMAGVLLATADAGANVRIKVLPNYSSTAAKTIDLSLAPTSDESQVIKPLDNLSVAELRAVQIEFTDPASPGTWELNGLAMKLTKGQAA